MLKNEVPQDDENIMQGKTRELCYAVDENGNYTTVLSAGWEAKNIIFRQTWTQINDNLAETEKQVRAGLLSPIAFFKEKFLMDDKILADYTGFSVHKVKKHQTPKGFAKLDEKQLAHYAEAFNINIEDLTKFNDNRF